MSGFATYRSPTSGIGQRRARTRCTAFTKTGSMRIRRSFKTSTGAPRQLLGCKSVSISREVEESILVGHTENGNGNYSELPSGGSTVVQLNNSVVEIWRMNAQKFPNDIAVIDPHHKPGIQMTYSQLEQEMRDVAAGLQSLGLAQGNKVSLFAENSARWIVADQSIMMNAAVNVVRGAVSPPDELAYILEHSESTGLVIQDTATLKKLLPLLSKEAVACLKFIVVLFPDSSSNQQLHYGSDDAAALTCPVLSYEEVLTAGQEMQQQGRLFVPATPAKEDLATLVYTSGTTGKPKGVMLTHGNLLYQVHNLKQYLHPQPQTRTLSLLPPWHIYERTVSYFIFSCGCCQVYTNIRKFRDDLAVYPPDYLVCVPLVLDTLYQKVSAQLKKASAVRKAIATTLLSASIAYLQAQRVLQGMSLQYARSAPSPAAIVVAWITTLLLRPVDWLSNKLVLSKIRSALGIKILAVSGGGALASHLDDFFEAIGLPVINGWGMTETSPVLACRSPSLNVRGSVGLPMRGTEIRVVDPVTREALPDGTPGLVLARGPGVMAGYYRNTEATGQAFAAGEGWLDTGDLGWKAPRDVLGSRMGGAVVLTGRSKDTVVLSSGENIEPAPIEDALASSSRVKHVLVVGQDRRELGALVFPDPEMLQLDEQARRQEEAAIAADIDRLNRQRFGYRSMEHIAHVAVVWEALSVEDGTLTRTMKPRRAAILEKYATQADKMLAQLRR